MARLGRIVDHLMNEEGGFPGEGNQLRERGEVSDPNETQPLYPPLRAIHPQSRKETCSVTEARPACHSSLAAQHAVLLCVSGVAVAESCA